MELKKRNDVIDVAKGIGILLVVFAHINFTQPWQTIIYSFHMPLFFILSGTLFKPQKYHSVKELLCAKLQTMIYPYIFFCVLGGGTKHNI